MKRYDASLDTFLRESTIEGTLGFGLKERIKLAIKIVSEVAKVHKTEIVHRDIKPSNWVLDMKNLDPVLVDFGLAYYSDKLKGSGGTPGFTSPEQFSGDHQSYPVDVFSLGKLLVIILFKFEYGWKVLWSPKTMIESIKLASLKDILNTISLMLQVKSIKISFKSKILNASVIHDVIQG